MYGVAVRVSITENNLMIKISGLHQGQLCPPGDTEQCLKVFLAGMEVSTGI